MKKVMIKFLCSVLLIFTLFAACSCSGYKLKKVSFTLNYDRMFFNPPELTFIRDEYDFNTFLNNNSIFKDDLSDEFEKANKKYDSDFFKDHYLCAIIIHSDSSQTKGYKLKKVEIENRAAIIHLKADEPKNASIDKGKYFTYYLALEKGEITRASLEFDEEKK